MASIGSESPPRKKLKQARLPFQVISSPRTEGDKASGGLKRKLSESDDIQITKVVKTADVEEIKENTIQDDLKNGMKAKISTLLTSKIINNCTEPAEDDVSLQKVAPKEEIRPKSPEVQIVAAEDSAKKAILSKNALDKLSAWKKSPPKNEPIAKKETVECTDEKTEQSTPCETSKETPLTVSEISSKMKCDTNSLSQAEMPDKEEVDSSSAENKLSPSAAVVEISDGQSENSNHSADNSITEIDLEADSDKKQGDFNNDTPTASPKASLCNLTASPRTPKGLSAIKPKLTPKQLAKLKEAAKKQEEKDRIKMEKERKRQEEQKEKLRLKLEKEEQKQKEKEEKEEQKRKEKEEKEKKRLAEIEQKNEEKRRKDEQKAEEKRKKESEKRKAEEEEERKKAKVSAMFTSYFAKPSKPAEKDSPTPTPTVQNFMPFEVKPDMRVAPCTRDHLDSSRLNFLDEILQTRKDFPTSELYVEQLRRGLVQIHRSDRTWIREETEEEVSILEPDAEGVFVEQPKGGERVRAKLLQFHDSHPRPAYYGTWRKKSSAVTGRRPVGQDKILDYDVDSADEWEEEEPGESLHGSDDEKDKESEDEYEVDNSVFVPHGYLSDDEGDAEIDEDALNPEMQKAKLKILGEEFATQMKTKTSVLKPIVILLTAAMQSAKLPGSLRYQKLLDRRAVWREDEGPIDLARQVRSEASEGPGGSPLAQRLDADGATPSALGRPKADITDEAIPALITLIHGALFKAKFLVSEFQEFLKRQNEVEEAPAGEPTAAAASTASGEKSWPKLPMASKASITRKIKELATYTNCTEEGPLKGKRCWIVPPEKREQFGVADLKLPNRWKFILKRPRPDKRVGGVAGVAGAEAKGSPSVEPSHLGQPTQPVEVPTPSAKKSLITNFTKIMTEEEKQKDWEKMKKSPPAKKAAPVKPQGKITSFTALFPSSASSAAAAAAASPAAAKVGPPPQAQPSKTVAQQQSPAPVKKRVALLVSVPRGQDISSAVKAARTSDAAATSGSANTVATVGNAVQAAPVKTEKPSEVAPAQEPELIELD